MDNCWISCQVMAYMEKFYNDLIIIIAVWNKHNKKLLIIYVALLSNSQRFENL